MPTYTVTHWGIYQARMDGDRAVALEPFDRDPDPSPIGLSMLDACQSELRVQRPSVRRSWLTDGPGACPELRGREPFVEVSWTKATELVAQELQRVGKHYGNGAIFGGSYGWSSAGRFHHVQSHIHRFLNCTGGYVRSVDTYSLGAGRVIMPHIVASLDELMAGHTSWNVLKAHTRLFISLGGVPLKNAQVTAGGPGEHGVKRGLSGMRDAGVRFINISPTGDDLETGADVEWIAIRPNTDCALLLGLAHVLYSEKLFDRAFLERYTVGFDVFTEYLSGQSDGQPKNPQWAESITGVPAARIVALAREMAATRTMINAAWSLQRAHHGEQPYWMLVTLTAMLGQIGLPGGGFGMGYGAINMVGNAIPKFSGPTFPQGRNGVADFIPVARISDMLLQPGTAYDYNGANHTYPEIKLVYWAGGNPFHHHQDLNKMVAAWQKPDTIIVHEQFWNAAAKMADIVLPATTTLERDDIGYATRERYMVSMQRLVPPVGEARDDYDIFTDIAEKMGLRAAYTEGLDASQWQRRLYEECRPRAEQAGVSLPDYDTFLKQQIVDIALPDQSVIMLEGFRKDPEANPLKTASGKIEIFSEKIHGYAYDDCAGHARWYEPVEWLGSTLTQRFPLHLLSDQPKTKLHSQLDHSNHSRAHKIAGREPVTLHPADAARRGIAQGDIVKVWNDRGACIAAAVISDRIRNGVVKLSTGAWFDPASHAEHAEHGKQALEKHGNPNTLTLDIGASKLSQGCIAQTCLVEIELFKGLPPAVSAFQLPAFAVLT